MSSATLTENVTVSFTDTPASGKSAAIYLHTHGNFNVGANVQWIGGTNRVSGSTMNLYEFARIQGTNYGSLLTRQVSTNEVQGLAQLLSDFAALEAYAQNLSFNNLDGSAAIQQLPVADDGENSSDKVVRADDSRLNANPNTLLGYDQTTNDTVKASWTIGVGTNQMIHAKAEVWFAGATNTDRGGFTIVGEASRTTTGDLELHTGTTNISKLGTTTGRDAYFSTSGTNFLLNLQGPAGAIANWKYDGRYGILTNGDITILPPSNTLTNGLVAYWKMDEAADGITPVNRADSWINNITLVDAIHTDDLSGKFGQAADFETGDNDTMAVATDLAALDTTNSFTVLAWFRKESASILEYIVSKWNTAGNRSWGMQVSAANIVQFVLSTNGSSATHTLAANTKGAITINTWYHGAIRFDDAANELAIFVDGQKDTLDIGELNPFNSSQPVRVSGHTTNSSLFDGRVDEVLIYDRALTDAEIAEIYNGGTGKEIETN
jgi:hypothetical protein